MPIKPPIGGDVSAVQKVHVKADTPEWEAWQTYRKKNYRQRHPDR
jgi:hypothetical protein